MVGYVNLFDVKNMVRVENYFIWKYIWMNEDNWKFFIFFIDFNFNILFFGEKKKYVVDYNVLFWE